MSAGPDEREARLHRFRHDGGPWGAGAGDRESLTDADAESGHRDEVVDALQTLGANPGPETVGEPYEELRQCLPGGVVANAVDQRTVEFDDVGPDAHELLQPRVAGAGVVDGDATAAGPDLRQRDLERRVVGRGLVLGDLDHQIAHVARERLQDDWGRERRRACVEGQVDARGALVA